jgi:hypothetical protein
MVPQGLLQFPRHRLALVALGRDHQRHRGLEDLHADPGRVLPFTLRQAGGAGAEHRLDPVQHVVKGEGAAKSLASNASRCAFPICVTKRSASACATACLSGKNW